MSILHLLAIVYLVLVAVGGAQLTTTPDHTVKGPLALACFLFPIALAIYVLTLR